MPSAHKDLRALALAAARAGGAAAQRHFRQSSLGVDTKPDRTWVTNADRDSEAAVRAVLAAQRPGDRWLGEETGAGTVAANAPPPPGPERTWIVDPVDGTRNFVRGIPLWSVLVACQEDGRTIASAVGFPALDEWYDAARGGGARGNGRPIHVSAIDALDEGLFAYYAMPMFERAGHGALWRELALTAQITRGGGDAYMHALVASGRAECCVELGLKPWDIAATALLVEEAGGKVESWRAEGGHVLSNGHVHAEVMAIVHRHAGGT
jgi:histidinol phosphatase-like enzyme (inositol monophosphatase family)